MHTSPPPFSLSHPLLYPNRDQALVQRLRETTRIPILGLCESVCHVYVDKECDVQKAIQIVLDSKNSEVETGCNRGVANLKASSNAMDTLLVHEDLAEDGRLLEIIRAMRDAKIELLGGPRASSVLGLSESYSLSMEWGSEAKATIEIVSSVDDAVQHIGLYGSSLADSIVTTNEATGKRFLDNVDSACVFYNASTRFADGYRLGIGAETGVSAKRAHSGRGPVGVKGLLTSRMVCKSGVEVFIWGRVRCDVLSCGMYMSWVIFVFWRCFCRRLYEKRGGGFVTTDIVQTFYSKKNITDREIRGTPHHEARA